MSEPRVKSVRGKLRGVLSSLVTPFRPNGRLDEATFSDLVERQVRARVDGIVVAGTTGEGLALTVHEFEAVIRIAHEVAGAAPRHRRPIVVAGTGSASTSHTAELTERAASAGADAALVVAPFYQRPTQSGVQRHFLTVADERQLPIVLYNSPERTGCNIERETLAELSHHDWVIGYKEAAADFRQYLEVASAPPDIALLVGRDEFAVPLLLMGWKGVVSVAANIVPDLVVKISAACLGHDLPTVHRHQDTYYRWIQATHVDVSPVPTKAALAILGQCRETVRAPLVSLTTEQLSSLRSAMAELLPLARFSPRELHKLA